MTDKNGRAERLCQLSQNLQPSLPQVWDFDLSQQFLETKNLVSYASFRERRLSIQSTEETIDLYIYSRYEGKNSFAVYPNECKSVNGDLKILFYE